MMHQLLDLLASNQDDLTKNDLCSRLNISPARLENMLMILEQKGKVRVAPNDKIQLCNQHTSCPSPGKSCPGPENCALVMKLPLGIEIITEK